MYILLYNNYHMWLERAGENPAWLLYIGGGDGFIWPKNFVGKGGRGEGGRGNKRGMLDEWVV